MTAGMSYQDGWDDGYDAGYIAGSKDLDYWRGLALALSHEVDDLKEMSFFS